MAVNYSAMVYWPNYEFFARAITVTPLASQPGAAAYGNRGIYGTRALDVETEMGMAILSDQETIVDVLEEEYGVVPIQGDLIDIPAYQGIPAVGLFEVTSTSTNGGGETTLVVRKMVTAAPAVGFREA